MFFTREDYMNKEVSHDDYHAQFATEQTKAFILKELNPEQIKEALQAGDKHLNSLKIPFNNMARGGNWWWDMTPINKGLLKELGETDSAVVRTCVGKACAKLLIND